MFKTLFRYRRRWRFVWYQSHRLRASTREYICLRRSRGWCVPYGIMHVSRWSWLGRLSRSISTLLSTTLKHSNRLVLYYLIFIILVLVVVIVISNIQILVLRSLLEIVSPMFGKYCPTPKTSKLIVVKSSCDGDIGINIITITVTIYNTMNISVSTVSNC